MTDRYVSMAQIRASKKIQKNQHLSAQEMETAFIKEVETEFVNEIEKALVEDEPYSEISIGGADTSVDGEEGPSVDGDAPSCSGVSSNSGQSSHGNDSPYVEYMPATRKVVLKLGPDGLGMSVVGGIKTPEHGLIPVIITDIDPGGEVDKSQAVKVGDRIVSVNGDSMEDKTHRDVVLAIKGAGDSIMIEVTEGPQEIRDYIAQELDEENE